MAFSINVTESEGIEPGSYSAVLFAIAEVGLQPGYKGNPPERKVVFSFELPGHKLKDGGFWTISKIMRLKFSKKSDLTKTTAALLGKPEPFDNMKAEPKSLLGKACIINVGKSETGKSKIVSVSAMIADLPAPAGGNELLYFDIDTPDPVVKNKLPEFVQKMIDSALSEKSVTHPQI